MYGPTGIRRAVTCEHMTVKLSIFVSLLYMQHFWLYTTEAWNLLNRNIFGLRYIYVEDDYSKPWQIFSQLNFVSDGSFVHLFMYLKQNFLCHHVSENTVVFST